MTFLTIEPGHIEKLSLPGMEVEAAHRFDKRQIDAVNAALGAGRPLLVRGEPGIGKSQLARAVAKVLKRAYLPFVTDARTESRDLLWTFDAVARLADAQAWKGAAADQKTLPVEHYIQPGALWWAFNSKVAKTQADDAKVPAPDQTDGGKWENGSVVLVDEIDKADSDVPNGLLEALGAGRFEVRGSREEITVSGIPPLIVITTNEERALPDAFVRRCLVLHLTLATDEGQAKAHFLSVGEAHFGGRITPDLLETAAGLVAAERQRAFEHHWRPLPGQAEFIDLLRSVLSQSQATGKAPEVILNTVKDYVLRKDPSSFPASERDKP